MGVIYQLTIVYKQKEMEDESENARLMKRHNVLKGEPRTCKDVAIFDSIRMLLILEYRRVIDWIKVFELKSVLEDAISLQKYISFLFFLLGTLIGWWFYMWPVSPRYPNWT